MKIQSIGTYLPASKLNTPSHNYKTINRNKDIISFKAENNDKRKFGFRDYLKGIFNKKTIPQVACIKSTKRNLEDLSDEEIKSEKIKEFVGLTLASYSDFGILGKNNQREINSMLRVGADNFYEGSVEYNTEDGINITFGEMNQELGIPKMINVWEGGQYAYTYDIFEKEPLKYSVTVFADKLQTVMEGEGKELTRFLQYDRSNKIVKEYTLSPGGFRYLYGLKKNGDEVQILKRLYFDFEDIAGCIYAEATDDGIVMHCYDIENDLWEPKYLLEADEE